MGIYVYLMDALINIGKARKATRMKQKTLKCRLKKDIWQNHDIGYIKVFCKGLSFAFTNSSINLKIIELINSFGNI